jgi:hypothetical protein
VPASEQDFDVASFLSQQNHRRRMTWRGGLLWRFGSSGHNEGRLR